ncbi:PREDICTED: stress-induced protein KIN2 [Camelina sativa]|uniref:Stress-induced protein KIN2 n=1 Tax=Camelina sativa TaxID=90675 RepID=A0ABM1QBD8_CAMSA|nr:PREDICTED: stress-induced protein KIN2 [Camelina sativa]XP_019090628.1 PREDICTED: stress-induced protein KIN2 [Camelina sativa]
MSETNKNAFQAGQAAGKAEEKSNVLLDKAKDAANAAGASAQQAGKNISDAAAGGVNFVKDKTGMNK